MKWKTHTQEPVGIGHGVFIHYNLVVLLTSLLFTTITLYIGLKLLVLECGAGSVQDDKQWGWSSFPVFLSMFSVYIGMTMGLNEMDGYALK